MTLAREIAANAPLTIRATKEMTRRILAARRRHGERRGPRRDVLHERRFQGRRHGVPGEAAAAMDGDVTGAGSTNGRSGCMNGASAAPSSNSATDPMNGSCQFPVTSATYAEHERRKDRGQRRPRIHQAAGGPREFPCDVHRDRPHRPDHQLRTEERRAERERDDGESWVTNIGSMNTNDPRKPAMTTFRRAFFTSPVLCRMRSLTSPPTIVAAHAGEEHRRREERRLPDVQLVLVEKKRRQPVQVQPQRPPVAEVHDCDRHHAARERTPRNRRPLHGQGPPRFGSGSSSSGVIPSCSAGMSRK